MNNNQAWEELFRKHDILRHIEQHGEFRISADQIRKYREPRLMTKFDHKVNLPPMFAKNELAILPVTRGDYIIAHFEAYHEIESCNSGIIHLSLPEGIQSLDCNNIPSEAIALNCAFAAGIITDFLDDDAIIPTVSGRMGTGAFDFNVNDSRGNANHIVSVSNAQMEIDATYEGRSCMAVIEAKRELSDDFIIRQIYYPFRVWQNRITKPVRPVFFVYSNGIFSLYEYAFDNLGSYSSIHLVKHRNYSVEDTIITAQDIQNILQSVHLVNEPEHIPFPQADKFERVLNLCELLNESSLSKQDITQQYAFVPRQADYYVNAARYLGLAEKESKGYYTISKDGRRILAMSYRNRQLELCRKILSHRVFHEALASYFSSGCLPSPDKIKSIMLHSELDRDISGDTFTRRAATIRSWLNWITSLLAE